jgi:hypothetical protein
MASMSNLLRISEHPETYMPYIAAKIIAQIRRQTPIIMNEEGWV